MTSSSLRKVINALKKEASLGNSRGKYQLAAAVLDDKGTIISIATNSYLKTHPKQAKCAIAVGTPDRVYLHAEVASIIKSRGQGSSIAVIRVASDGELRTSKPCAVCMYAIAMSQLDCIHYFEKGGIVSYKI